MRVETGKADPSPTLRRENIDPAFENLLSATESRVRAFLRRLADSDADADDALQECFVRAWRSRDRFDARRGSFPAWIMRIAFHSFLDLRDAQKRAPRLLGDGDVDIEDFRESTARDNTCIEDREEVEARLETLRDVERDVLLRFHRDGESIEEIASRVGLPRGTVKSHLHRARARLRRRPRTT